MAGTVSAPTARPKTSEGINITELGVKRANPTPVVLEEVDILLEEYLSPRKLKALTGMDDLTKVKCLQLKVDTTETSLGNFGNFLPNLQELKIKDGIVTSIRDLGSSLSNLQILWMPRCSLEEIDGISAMDNLAELFIAYNDVSELSPLTMLEHLRLLDIEGNNVDDLKQVEYLACCQKLATLTLDGNPVASAEKKQQGQAEYRRTIKRIVPQLQYLDDVQLSEVAEVSDSKPGNEFEDDWNYINTFILTDNTTADSPSVPSAQSLQATCRPPSTDSSRSSVHTPLPRPTTGYRPGSALKPSSTEKHSRIVSQRSNQSYPQTARPPSTAGRRPQSEDLNSLKDTASELTMGEVVCGNPAKSLRGRVRSARGMQVNDLGHLTSTARSREDASPEAASANGSDNTALDDRTIALFEEAMTFRKQHEATRKLIAQERAPQVLKIDYEEAQSDRPESDYEEERDEDAGSSRSRAVVANIKELPHPASPSGALKPLKVPTPPNRVPSATNRSRRLFANDRSKAVPIPPPTENTVRSPGHSSILLPSKFAVSK